MLTRAACTLVGARRRATSTRLALALTGVTSLFGTGARSKPPARKLGLPVAVFDFDFSHIGAAHELPSGLVLVSDFTDGVLRLVDTGAGTARVEGRSGEGPLKYRSTGGLTLRRDPDASPALLRLGAASGRPDTISLLRPPESTVAQASANALMSRVTQFSPADDRAVFADGTGAVVRADPFRVDWHAPSGAITSEPSIEYDRLPVTDEDKSDAASALRGERTPRLSSSASSGGVRTVDAGSIELRNATFKPPLYAESVKAAHDGRLWVRRYTLAKVHEWCWTYSIAPVLESIACNCRHALPSSDLESA